MTIRRGREANEQTNLGEFLNEWRRDVISRRRFLVRMAGGSLAVLFPTPGLLADASKPTQGDHQERQWQVLAAVQEHLLPSEPNAPGAREINAVGYLRFVVTDSATDQEDREFILKGSDWLEEMALEHEGSSFLELTGEQRERVLRRIEQSQAGENWLSTMLLHIFEALLTDPVYGGNPDGIGWRWLQHTPGFPRPPANKRYPLLS